MAKKLFADGITGDVVVYQGDDDAITNPFARLQDVFFHSALDYMTIVQAMAGTLSLPARQADPSDDSRAYGDAIYTIGTHSLGYTPMLFGWIENLARPFAGDTIIFAGGQASVRTLVLGADDQRVMIRERYLHKDVSAPAQQIQYRIWIFEEVAASV